MKNTSLITAFLTTIVIGSGSITSANSPTTKATVTTSLASMPLAFTENQGQWDSEVLFCANAGGATMWFTKSGVYYQFTRRIPGTNDPENPPQGVGHPVDNSVIPAKAGIQSRGRLAKGETTSAPLSIDAAHEDIRRARDLVRSHLPEAVKTERNLLSHYTCQATTADIAEFLTFAVNVEHNLTVVVDTFRITAFW